MSTPSPLTQHIAANILYARKSQGHTQESLARKIGVVARSVGQWEQQLTVPSRRSLEALAAELGYPPAWFYAEHDDLPAAA